MPDLADLFPGYASEWINTSSGRILARVGGRGRAVARGFLPYKLHFVLESTVLEPGRVVQVRVRGDLDGTWQATLSPEDRGTRVDIVEEVIAEKPLLRVLSPLLKPLFAWNHYWTTPRGEAGLREYLAERRVPLND